MQIYNFTFKQSYYFQLTILFCFQKFKNEMELYELKSFILGYKSSSMQKRQNFKKNYQVNTPSYLENVPLKHQLKRKKEKERKEKKIPGWKLRNSITRWAIGSTKCRWFGYLEKPRLWTKFSEIHFSTYSYLYNFFAN